MLKKIIAIIMTLITSGIGLLLYLTLVEVINMRLLRAGYFEGAGLNQFIRALAGWPLLFLVGITWLGLTIFSFEYYLLGAKNHTLIKRFTLITSIELFLIPLSIFIYQIGFKMPMIAMEWFFAGAGLFLGCICLYIYRESEQESAYNR